jgi:hypothetical protein
MSQALSRGWTGRIALASLVFAMTAIPPLAIAASGQAPGSAGGQKVPSKVTFIDAPSSEKPAAREKRLKRECKGRPNAGMCLGHTR